jgi:hypothetical protein
VRAVARRRAALAGAGLLAALLLAACGGGGADAMPPAPPTAQPSDTDQVPASAAVSSSAWEAFAIAQAPSETTEPLKLDRIASVPTSETEAPIVLP